MALDTKERRELVSHSLEHLQNVIGASGRAEELVRLTTQVVQNGKRLSEGIPEGMRTRSTAILADFVIAARAIAKDARAVDSNSLQKLGRTKRAVESLIEELDNWHASQSPPKRDEIELALEDLVPESSSKSKSRPGGSSPPQTPISEREKKLTEELKKQQKRLMKKMDPQAVPEQHGRPEDILKMAVTGLSRSSDDLMELASQKSPTKEHLLEPMILMSRMVAMLMDLVDSLFVSKYPMRAQVHSFCCTLMENVLVYSSQSKSDDAASLRTLCVQTPALLNAVEVMVEQCSKRVQDVEKSREKSIQRKVDLHELDVFGPGPSPGNSPKAGRKRPDVKKMLKEKAEFEVHCIVCTNMAVDGKTRDQLPKGTELTLKVMPTTTILDIRSELSTLTGLPIDHIELKLQGDDVLPDTSKATPNNPVPYFMFNLCEPNEEEMKEIKRVQKRKNRLTIKDSDWSKVSGPIAVALYDYEALGEDGNLEFDEGDVIEIIQKSADGWWTGRLDDKTGDFPASFVEEIQAPRSKEEHKKLVKMFKKRDFGTGRVAESQAETISFDDEDEAHGRQSSRSQLQVTASTNLAAAGVKAGHGAPRRGSDSPPKSAKNLLKFSRRTSEPVFTQAEESGKQSKAGGHKKKSLFKRRPGTQYTSIPETNISSDFSFHPNRSPILSRKNLAGSSGASGATVSNGGIPSDSASRKPLVKPASSPRVAPKLPLLPPGQGSRSPNPGAKRRPPPPPPPPYARTHGRKGLTDLLERQDSEEKERTSSESSSAENPQESPPSTSPPLIMRITKTEKDKDEDKEDKEEEEEEEEEEETSPSSLGPSNSMEELLKNLEEFDAVNDTIPKKDKEEGKGEEREYATIPRSELPVHEDKKRTSESETSPSVPIIDVSAEAEPHSEPIPARPQRRPKPPSKPKPTPPPKPVENGFDREQSPQPTPPPRVKRGRLSQKAKETKDQVTEKGEEGGSRGGERERGRGGGIEGGEDKIERREKPERPRELKRPGNSAPLWQAPPPPARPPISNNNRKKKCKSMLDVYDKVQPLSAPVSRTGSPDDSSLGVGKLARETWASSDALESKPPPSRSPVVQRRTIEVVSSSTPEPPFSDDELEDCTGIGKEGVLHKEGTSSHDWKARFFRLKDNKITYYKADSALSEDVVPLGQILVARMQGAVPLGERNGFLCFAIKMRYDTSVVLGAHTQTELDDWVRSINKMIKVAKSKGGGKRGIVGGGGSTGDAVGKEKRRASSHATAMQCITYLSDCDRPAQDRVLVSGGGNMGQVNRWLGCIEYGEEPELSDMPDAVTAVSLLKLLFREERLGPLVLHDTAKELCDKLKSASPVSVLRERLEKLPSDSRKLLKHILRLFGQVMENTDKNHTYVEDLNKVYGPLLFESLATVQSEPLLAYLISTCELVIS